LARSRAEETIDTPEAFAAAFDVSRETLRALEAYRTLLEHWNRRINLVSRASLPGFWHRHAADSAQLWDHRPPGARRWLDLGSGAGFPGLVIAMLASERQPELQVVLVESDHRKAAFLGAVAAELALAVTIRAERIEALPPQAADVVSARALAPLPRLLDHLDRHRAPGGIGLFLKGEAVHKEIASAAARWRFEHRIHPSRTDPHAAIFEIGALTRA
jgi:16S rRNA (guanine527-N7)-methyltransferase